MKLPRRQKSESEDPTEARKRRRLEREARARAKEERRAKAQAASEAAKRAKAQAPKRPKPRSRPALRTGLGARARALRERVGGGSGPRATKQDPKGSADAKGSTAKRPASGKRRLAGSATADLGKLGAGLSTGLTELVKLGREMLVIPAQLWMAAAEIAGAAVLAAWRRAVVPALRALLALGRAAVRLGLRHVTPGRAVTGVALVALVALAASQWLDYREVSVGTGAYSGEIQAVAPAPQIDTATAGDAHAWVMLPLAAAGLLALGLAVFRRPGIGRMLIVVGVAVIAISVIVDAPKGLDEGAAAVAYEGAKASLLEGFWLQIVTGAVLIACGLMLPAYLRPAPVSARRRAEPGPGGGRVGRLVARGRARIKRGVPAKRGAPPLGRST